MPPSELTEDLLSDLLQAGLKAPGFSEQQKWHLWQGLLPFSQRIARVSTLSEIWPWLALSKTPGRDEDIIRVSTPVEVLNTVQVLTCPLRGLRTDPLGCFYGSSRQPGWIRSSVPGGSDDAGDDGPGVQHGGGGGDGVASPRMHFAASPGVEGDELGGPKTQVVVWQGIYSAMGCGVLFMLPEFLMVHRLVESSPTSEI